jgi:integrase
LVISEPKAKRSRRDVPLSPATVALLRSVKDSQAAERLKAASIWVETGLVFTTERGRAVDPRNALRAINTAAKAFGHQRCRPAHVEALICHAHVRGRRATSTVSELLGHASSRSPAPRRPRLHRGRALRRPAALSSNGLVRTCAVATPMATRQQRGRLGFCPKRPLTCCFPSG